MNVTRLNVNLNMATADALKGLSADLGVPMTEVVRRAISIYAFVDDERARGNQILIAEPDGTCRELVML